MGCGLTERRKGKQRPEPEQRTAMQRGHGLARAEARRGAKT